MEHLLKLWPLIQSHLDVLVTGGVFLFGLKMVVHFGPRLIVPFLHNVLEAARKSPWVADPAQPHRKALLRAVLAFLEAEIPDPGTGREVYARFGAWMAVLPLRLAALAPRIIKPPLLVIAGFFAGTAGAWAEAAAAFGDAVDTELENEGKAIDSAPGGSPPASDAPPKP